MVGFTKHCGMGFSTEEVEEMKKMLKRQWHLILMVDAMNQHRRAEGSNGRMGGSVMVLDRPTPVGGSSSRRSDQRSEGRCVTGLVVVDRLASGGGGG